MTSPDPTPKTKRTWRKVTQAGILLVLTVALIYDVFVALTPETGDTISESTRDYSIYPVVPALIGGLGGHFFFWEIRLVPGIWGMACAIGMLMTFALWSVLVKNQLGPELLISAHQFCSRHPVIVFVIATILGGLFWGLGASDKKV